MNRRRFLQASGATVAASLLGGRDRELLAQKHRIFGSREITYLEFERNRQFLTTDYGRIAYVESGKGQPLLLLHGFPLNSFQWRGVIPRLSGHRRCIAPDFLGLGNTETSPAQSVAPDSQASMILQFLDRLSIASIDVIANDSGGAIAQLLAARHPERVRTLLLTNCDTEPDSPPAAVKPVIELARAGRFADEWLAPWLADKALARSTKGIGGMCYADPRHPTDEAIEAYLSPLLSSPLRKAQTNAYAVGLDPNPLAGIETALQRCKIPTRIVWGTGDTIFAQSSADYLDRTFANSRGVRRVQGAKLFFPEEMPDVIAEEAIRLWRA